MIRSGRLRIVAGTEADAKLDRDVADLAKLEKSLNCPHLVCHLYIVKKWFPWWYCVAEGR